MSVKFDSENELFPFIMILLLGLLSWYFQFKIVLVCLGLVLVLSTLSKICRLLI